jgi:hypothetical protein
MNQFFFLCDEVVGCEKVVNYRRQFFNVYDDVYNHRGDNNWHHISSGSKAEGLNLDVIHYCYEKNIYISICITIVYKRIPKETYRTNCVQILLLFLLLAEPVLQITSIGILSVLLDTMRA